MPDVSVNPFPVIVIIFIGNPKVNVLKAFTVILVVTTGL